MERFFFESACLFVARYVVSSWPGKRLVPVTDAAVADPIVIGPRSSLPPSNARNQLLRGTIVNRTRGIHKKPIYLTVYSNNIWSY